jgi:hypothetical protein
VTITHAELLDALATASTAPEDAQTVGEICAATGIPIRRVRDGLRALQAAGRLGVHSVMRPDLGGRMQRVPAYTIHPATKPKARR